MEPATQGRTSTPARRRPYAVLAVCIGSYFAVRFAQVILGPVLPLILESFTVSPRAAGVALTGMWLAYALAQLPSGAAADRVGERPVVVAALAITAGATLGVASAPSFLWFGVGVLVLGVGAGLYYNPATTLLAREFTGIGRAIGSHRVGGQLAGVVAPVVAAAVGVRYGWRPAMAAGAVVAVLVAVLLLREIPAATARRPSAPLRDAADWRTVSTLLSATRTRQTTVMMTLVEFVDLAAMAFLPTLLVAHHQLSLGRANLLFALFFGMSALVQPIGGWLSDRIGRDPTTALLMAAGVVGFGVLATGGPLVLTIPAVVLAGIAMSCTPVLQSRMLDGLSPANRGTGFGLFRTLYLVAGATGTTVVGTAADVAGWGVSFGLLAALLGVVCLSALAIPGGSEG